MTVSQMLSWPQWRCRHSRAREIALFTCILCFTMLWLSEKLAPSVCKAIFQDQTSELLDTTTRRGDGMNSKSMNCKADVLRAGKMLHPSAFVTPYLCREVPPVMLGNSLKYFLVRSYVHHFVCNAHSL